MAMSESWLGDALERKYLITTIFDDATAWSDQDRILYDNSPSPSWQTLDLPDVGDMFHARVLRTGTDQAPWHQIVLHRTPLGSKFGKTPVVAIRLTVTHDEEVIYQNGSDDLTWYEDVPMSEKPPIRVKDNAKAEGYQEHSLPMAVLLKSQSFQDNPSFKVDLEIRIKTSSGEDGKTSDSTAQKIVVALAGMLKDPTAGNVEFVFPAADGSVDEHTPRLYAFSHVLESSPAFDYCFLNSDFSNGVVSVPPSPTSDRPPSPTSPNRRIIFVNEAFELFHLVLYYIYTERICFVTTPDIKNNSGIPPTTGDAEGIYAIAHRLMVESLKEKAFHFLKATTNLENISSRTFGKFAATHKQVGNWYDKYFMEHWPEIKRRDEFEQVFAELEDDHEESLRVNKKFRAMIKERD